MGKLDKLAGKKSFEELLADYVPAEQEVKPSITAGKSFVNSLIPDEMKSEELKRYTEMNEGDDKNPNAKTIGETGAALYSLSPLGPKAGKIISEVPNTVKAALGSMTLANCGRVEQAVDTIDTLNKWSEQGQKPEATKPIRDWANESGKALEQVADYWVNGGLDADLNHIGEEYNKLQTDITKEAWDYFKSLPYEQKEEVIKVAEELQKNSGEYLPILIKTQKQQAAKSFKFADNKEDYNKSKDRLLTTIAIEQITRGNK